MPKPRPVDEYSSRQIARAAYFTTCRFLGAGRYDKREFATLDAAREAAASIGDGRTMLYGVTPEGYTIHVANV